MLPLDDIRITRRLLILCIVVLLVAMLLIMVSPAQAAPVVLTDNQTLQGGTYGTVYVGNEGGVVIRDCTIGRLVVCNAWDLALVDVNLGSACIDCQYLSLQSVNCGPLVLRGQVHFIHGLVLTRPLVINASHVRIQGMQIRSSCSPLISGWGRDVWIEEWCTWGRVLLGYIGRDWSVWNGGHHGTRLTMWGPNTYPYGYPIGEGVFLYKVIGG